MARAYLVCRDAGRPRPKNTKRHMKRHMVVKTRREGRPAGRQYRGGRKRNTSVKSAGGGGEAGDRWSGAVETKNVRGTCLWMRERISGLTNGVPRYLQAHCATKHGGGGRQDGLALLPALSRNRQRQPAQPGGR